MAVVLREISDPFKMEEGRKRLKQSAVTCNSQQSGLVFFLMQAAAASITHSLTSPDKVGISPWNYFFDSSQVVVKSTLCNAGCSNSALVCVVAAVRWLLYDGLVSYKKDVEKE